MTLREGRRRLENRHPGEEQASRWPPGHVGFGGSGCPPLWLRVHEGSRSMMAPPPQRLRALASPPPLRLRVSVPRPVRPAERGWPSPEACSPARLSCSSTCGLGHMAQAFTFQSTARNKQLGSSPAPNVCNFTQLKQKKTCLSHPLHDVPTNKSKLQRQYSCLSNPFHRFVG